MKTPLQKRNEALARKTARASRTTAQQLAYLGTKPGEAKRERARLAKSK